MRVWFLLTGIFVLISSSVTGYLAFMAWYRSPKTRFCDVFTWVILFSGWTSALNASVGTLTRALFNVTTNELVNWPRLWSQSHGIFQTQLQNPGGDVYDQWMHQTGNQLPICCVIHHFHTGSLLTFGS
nr:unnamed protein product [Spirometra erinaceieuropaei]